MFNWIQAKKLRIENLREAELGPGGGRGLDLGGDVDTGIARLNADMDDSEEDEDFQAGAEEEEEDEDESDETDEEGGAPAGASPSAPVRPLIKPWKPWKTLEKFLKRIWTACGRGNEVWGNVSDSVCLGHGWGAPGLSVWPTTMVCGRRFCWFLCDG